MVESLRAQIVAAKEKTPHASSFSDCLCGEDLIFCGSFVVLIWGSLFSYEMGLGFELFSCQSPYELGLSVRLGGFGGSGGLIIRRYSAYKCVFLIFVFFLGFNQ